MKRFAAAFAPLVLTACVATPQVAGVPPPPVAPPPASADTSQGALALLPVLDAEAGPAANLFYSPASIAQAFGVLRLGAAGATRVQLESVLPPPRDPKGLATEKQGVEVRLANALWLSDQWRFRLAFVTEAARDYGATAEAIDVRQPAQAAARINAWAAKATDGLIPQITKPDSVTPDTAAIITNALYFDGLWQTAFDGWSDEPFLFGDGRERKFRLMREVLSVPLARAGGLTAVRLPYQNPRYAMDVIIPNRRTIMAKAPDVATITALEWRLGNAKPELVEVRLPQFEIDFAKGLIPTLQAIGLTLPFDDARADLSAMAEPGQRPLVVDAVQHIAKLQVFDTGTRAAAVTTIRIIPTGGRAYANPPTPFVVDRPFMIVIRDLDRREVLFLGRIANPQAFTPEGEVP